jgi:shikimate kinase
MSIVLIGYRGSGKTTIGKLLSKRLGQSFLDTDELIVKRAGKTIKQIFEDEGEARFRDIEADVVKQVLLLDEHVLAMGGGVVVRPENRAAIRAHALNRTFYLRCDPVMLYHRIMGDPKTAETRPALTRLGGSPEEIAHLLEVRQPLYREVMTAEIDVTKITPEEAVGEIVAMM